VTTTTGFTNDGTLQVDIFGGDGGSSLTIGGTLANNAAIAIGNGGLSASTTVTATGLAANAGSIVVQGNVTSGTTDQATLNITGAAPSRATSSIRVGGDGLLEFASGAITSVGSGSSLELDGAQARVALAADTSTSSALSTLATNNGTFLLRGGSNLGAGGASVTTSTGFANSGTLQVDVFGGDGGSSLTIGGRLINNATVAIGNGSLSASTTVTATSLVANAGSIVVQGNVTSGTTDQATLNITAAAPSRLVTNVRVSGDGLLEFASGAITSIDGGSSLELDGAQARVALAADTSTSSALGTLATNNGTFLLRGDSNLGAGGASVGQKALGRDARICSFRSGCSWTGARRQASPK
jgi:hypothetical protein